MNTTLTIGGDLTVGRLGFGAMRLTGPPAYLSRADALRVLRRAVELGVTFVDTADSYDLGANEELLGSAGLPPEVVIATKGGHVNLGHEWIPLGRPEYLRQQAELSLRRLRLDRLPLYQLHRVDPTVPLVDQVGALRRLQDEGKVQHVGLSEVTVAQLVEASTVTRIASVQNRYNHADRAAEAVLEHCERTGIAFIPWAPLGPRARTTVRARIADVGGAAASGTTNGVGAAAGVERAAGRGAAAGTEAVAGMGAAAGTDTPAGAGAAAGTGAVAGRGAVANGAGAAATAGVDGAAGGVTAPAGVPARGAWVGSDATAALVWLLRRSPVILPIPGTSSMVHLVENMAALEEVVGDARAPRGADAGGPGDSR